MDFKEYHLVPDPTLLKQVVDTYNSFSWSVDHGQEVKENILSSLISSLRALLPEQVLDVEEPTHLHLCHNNPLVLNLPWELLLEETSSIIITRGHSIKKSQEIVINTSKSPLRILILIAAPIDSIEVGRLNYEEEEEVIVRSFDSLFVDRGVEIHFAAIGSLAELERQLSHQKYHIIHISAHGRFDTISNTGTLLLENDVTGLTEIVKERDLADLIKKYPENRPVLVTLAACQTAQGSTTSEFQGITNGLLSVGIPAVVAMSMSILDRYAASFSSFLYKELVVHRSLPQAFKGALTHLRSLELDDRRSSSSFQSLIPQLYLSAKVSTIASKAILEIGKKRVEENQQFVGRRREAQEIQQHLRESGNCWVYGEPGVGKTTLLKQLIRRLTLVSANSILLDISGACFSKQELSRQLKAHLTPDDVQDQFNFISQLETLFSHQDLIIYIDDLKTEQIQNSTKSQFLKLLAKRSNIKLLVSSRYVGMEVEDLATYHLKQVSLIDIRKKLTFLELGKIGLPSVIVKRLARPDNLLTVDEVSQLVYGVVGGNYSDLEKVELAYLSDNTPRFKKEDEIRVYLDSLVDLTLGVSDYAWLENERGALSEQETAVLRTLLRFRFPMPIGAINWQLRNKVNHRLMRSLCDRYYLERIYRPQDYKKNKPFYYIPLLTRRRLDNILGPAEIFSERKAGRYFVYKLAWRDDLETAALREAFLHYQAAGMKRSVMACCTLLVFFLHYAGHYAEALEVGQETDEFTGERQSHLSLVLLGSCAEKTGNYDLAEQYYKRSIKGTTVFGINLVSNYGVLGMLSYRKGDISQAEKYYLKLRRYRFWGWHNYLIYYNGHGLVLHAQGQLQKALLYFHKALRVNNFVSKYLFQPDLAGEIHSSIALVLSELNQTEEGVDQMNLAISQQRIGLGKGNIRNNYALTLFENGLEEQAFYYFKENIQRQQREKNKSGEAYGLINLGYLYMIKGNKNKAYAYLKQGLKVSSEIDDRPAQAIALGNLGQYYYKYNNYERALESLHRSDELLVSIFGPKTSKRIMTVQTIASILFNQENFEQALNELEKLHLSSVVTTPPTVYYIYHFNYLGIACFKLGRWKEAITYYEQFVSLESKQDTPNWVDVYQAMVNLGNALNQLKRFPRATEVCLARLDIIEREDYNVSDEEKLLNRIACNMSLGSCYWQLGNNEQAIQSYHLAIQDSGDLNTSLLKEWRVLAGERLGLLYLSLDDFKLFVKEYKEATFLAIEHLPRSQAQESLTFLTDQLLKAANLDPQKIIELEKLKAELHHLDQEMANWFDNKILGSK